MNPFRHIFWHIIATQVIILVYAFKAIVGFDPTYWGREIAFWQLWFFLIAPTIVNVIAWPILWVLYVNIHGDYQPESTSSSLWSQGKMVLLGLLLVGCAIPLAFIETDFFDILAAIPFTVGSGLVFVGITRLIARERYSESKVTRVILRIFEILTLTVAILSFGIDFWARTRDAYMYISPSVMVTLPYLFLVPIVWLVLLVIRYMNRMLQSQQKLL